MKNQLTAFSLALLSLTALACSGAGTGTTGGSSTTNESASNSGSVVAAVFSSSAQASISAQALRAAIRNVEGEDHTPPSACESLEEDPGAVTSSSIDPDFADGSVTSKDYGPEGDDITLAESDFCEDSDGASNEGEDLFAHFILNDDVEATCDDGTSATMKAGSTGVWTQNETACPEIYGTFILEDQDGVESTANCHIIISCDSDSDEIESATCTDSEGETMTLDSGTTCEVDAE